MSVYPTMQMTNAAFSLQSRAKSQKKRIDFTRIALGDGELGMNNMRNLSNLISPRMTNLVVTNIVDMKNGQVLVEARCDNSQLKNGFFAKEMGVYAKCEGDSNDILYAYTNAGGMCPYVNDSTMPDVQLCQINIKYGDTSNLSIKIDDSTVVTNGRLTAVLEEHNTSNDAHKNLFTEDGTTINDSSINGSTIIQKLGARVKWVKSYVDNKLRTFSSFTTSQISDFKQKVLEYLLSNVAESAISTLNSDSLISKMVKKVLQVSGVRYSLGDNGYIVLGKFFGNFCIQWGQATAPIGAFFIRKIGSM